MARFVPGLTIRGPAGVRLTRQSAALYSQYPTHAQGPDVFVTFAQLTPALLLAADVVAAVDPRDPSRELPLYPPPCAATAASQLTVRVLLVVLDAHWRDEQVSHLRARLAQLRPLAPSTS
jgi:hypothetical protein